MGERLLSTATLLLASVDRRVLNQGLEVPSQSVPENKENFQFPNPSKCLLITCWEPKCFLPLLAPGVLWGLVAPPLSPSSGDIVVYPSSVWEGLSLR